MLSCILCTHRQLNNMGIPYLHQVCTLVQTFPGWGFIMLLVTWELQYPEVILPEHLFDWCLCRGSHRVPGTCASVQIVPKAHQLYPSFRAQTASALGGRDCCLKSQTPYRAAAQAFFSLFEQQGLIDQILRVSFCGFVCLDFFGGRGVFSLVQFCFVFLKWCCSRFTEWNSS